MNKITKSQINKAVRSVRKGTFPRNHSGKIVPITDRVEYTNYMFNSGTIPADYKYIDYMLKHNLLKELDSDLYSVVPEFYDDFTEYLCRRLDKGNMPKAERKSFYFGWDLAYITCGQAANYLQRRKPKSERNCTDDDIVNRDGTSLFRLYSDNIYREVKKPGKDRRTKEYRDWLAEQDASIVAEIDFANRNRSKTYDEWFNGTNPNDAKSEYTWRTREYEIVSVETFKPHDTEDDHFDPYDDVQCIALANGNLGRATRINPTEDAAFELMERERESDIISNFDDIEKLIIESLLDGCSHVDTYTMLKMGKAEFYRRLRNIKKVLMPLKSGNDIVSTKLSSETKRCSKCNNELSIDLFGNDKRKPDGKQSCCRECDRKRKAGKAK